MRQAESQGKRAVAPYQKAVCTSRPAEQVLGQFGVDRLSGIAVAERGAHYLLLRSARRFRYGADLAAGLGIAIVLGLLICAAITPLVLVGLPAALLPALPLLLDRRTDLALSAIEDEGTTRVTAHGQASPELSEYLDTYLASLPTPNGTGHATTEVSDAEVAQAG